MIGNYTISGLNNGQQYAVEIRAVSSVGAGAWSDVKNVTPTDGSAPGTSLPFLATDNATYASKVFTADTTIDTNDAEIECWMRTTDNEASAFILYSTTISTLTPYWFLRVNGGNFEADWRPEDGTGVRSRLTTSVPIADGNWHHLRAVLSGGTTHKAYVDGVEAAPTDPTQTDITGWGSFQPDTVGACARVRSDVSNISDLDITKAVWKQAGSTFLAYAFDDGSGTVVTANPNPGGNKSMDITGTGYTWETEGGPQE